MFFDYYLLVSIVTFSGGICLLLSSCTSLLRRKLIQKHTGVADVPFLGIERRTGCKIQGTAVVCGGSIAGLSAARVCHDHFEKVVIVEPEAWLATTEGWKPEREQKKKTRARVLQYQSLHGLSAFGFMALEKWFRNLRGECQKADISIGPADFKLAFYGNFLNLGDEKSRDSLSNTLFATRHGFEKLLRRLVIGNKGYPNIEQIVGTVTGIIPSQNDPTRLQGVSIRTNKGDEVLSASLVIDCSGAAEAGLKWLQNAGFRMAKLHSDIDEVQPLQRLKITYNPKVRYTTFQFTITPALAERLPIPGGYHNSRAIYTCISGGRVDSKILGIMRFEWDTLMLLCSTRGDVECPRSFDKVKAFARDIMLAKPMPGWCFQLLDELHDVEDSVAISTVRLPPLSYIRYHQAPDLPKNWIAIGDSVMKMNPIHGQGTSKAILGAVALNTVLRSQLSPGCLPANFSKLFFDAQAAKIDPMWEGTKTLDYGYECTIPVPGETLTAGRGFRWYSHRLNMVSFYDQQAGLAVWKGMQLLSPAIDLFNPKLVLKVLWDVLRRPSA
ncbi:hypothetical protein L208DRAFT_1436786 [Tricholoma matsutake]|nr:hypothetical protein L208DRAFT_1436786 [Tricholoma matsutake 945]